MDVDLRASDDDRHRVIADLQRHTTAGRLTLDEFTERAGTVWSARTLAELATVTRDLPVVDAAPHPSDQPRRDLLVLFAVAAVTLVLLGLLMAVTR